MSTKTRAKPPRLDDLALYASDAEIALAVCGKHAHQWPSIVPVLEREGLPQIDPLFGGRYVPAVKAWLDAKNGLGEKPGAADGPEEWEKWGRKRRA